MKILYAVQGTGNGHITRAIEIIPYLQLKGDVDILISGEQAEIDLPFKVKYRFKGLSFVFGKKGGIDLWNSYWNLSSLKLFKAIKSLDVKKYDLIISDFEPISCWAAIKAEKPCIGLSNQVATLHPLAPRPKKTDLIGKLVIQNYAPTTYNYGFHFKALDHNVFTPIIRREVREIVPSHKGHYTVYLPSYDDERIYKTLKLFKSVKWHVFSKKCKKKYKEDNVVFFPIQTEPFLLSMASSEGVLCNAGFGTTSEALFLKKKLLVIPMKNQFEQHCNAAMLESMGVQVLKKLHPDLAFKISDWLKEDEYVEVDYPDITEKIVDTIVENHGGKALMDTDFESNNYPLFQ